MGATRSPVASECTLILAITPKDIATIPANLATAFRAVEQMPDVAALSMSIFLDFFIKITGTGPVNLSHLRHLPFLTNDCYPRIRAALRFKALRLCCLTTHHAGLWYNASPAQPPTVPDT